MPAPTMDRHRVEAAIHFTQYLCAAQKVSTRDPTIDRDVLKAVFSEEYQPMYGVQCLELKTLLSTLAMAELLEKPPNNRNPFVTFKWNRIQDIAFKDGGLPQKPPTRLTKPKPRVIVSQRYTQIRDNEERPDGVSEEKCDICKVALTPATVEEHKASELHILRIAYRKSRKSFDDTKHLLGVRIIEADSEEPSPSGINLQVSCRIAIESEITIEFINLMTEREIFLVKVFPLIPHKDVQLQNVAAILLRPGQPQMLQIKAQFSARGAVLYPLVFKILPSGADKAKYFIKEIQFLTQSELMDQLAPTEAYRPSMGPVVRVQDAPMLPGKPCDIRVQSLKNTLSIGKLPFTIPPILLRFLNNGFKMYENMSQTEKKHLEHVRSLLPQGNSRDTLTQGNYAQLLELLLFIEEHQMSRDIHSYDMHSAVLIRNQGGLWLEVPGLVDKRPSLLLNDSLVISFVGDRSICYEGFVQRINGARVNLGLHDAFERKYTNQKLEVQFKINRGVLKSMHRALYIVSAHGVQHLLFPSKETRPIAQPPLRPWFNKAIERNPEQQAAVRNIVHNSSQNAPYLVFGPPGTGKTVTLVETIMQLWDLSNPRTRILVCTPSNSAADEIASRLLKVIYEVKVIPPASVKNHIFRMCAMSRSLSSMPAAIKSAGITNHDPRDEQVFFPPMHAIMAYDIVICTFSSSSKLVLAEFPAGHFTHIIMDEVGQALEPEALIPLAGLATVPHSGSFKCQVVMAGDPKQLGPVLQSPIAAKFGLDKSMLERLMCLPLYSKQPGTNRYNANVLTKLVLNYRSHPAILEVSNNLFYDGELKPIGEKEVTEAACNWDGLKKKHFPLVFHGVEGLDERQGSSPSFFNRQEVELVTDYIQKILADGIAVHKEIGVVTPYAMQVKKIKKALEILRLKNIDVASVEQFQGQERKVIIISTVRSRPEFLSFDYMFQLGFLQNPKRFNVAVTRARSLLVIVGNPNVLQHDICWRTLLKHCVDNGAYTGVPFQFIAANGK